MVKWSKTIKLKCSENSFDEQILLSFIIWDRDNSPATITDYYMKTAWKSLYSLCHLHVRVSQTHNTCTGFFLQGLIMNWTSVWIEHVKSKCSRHQIRTRTVHYNFLIKKDKYINSFQHKLPWNIKKPKRVKMWNKLKETQKLMIHFFFRLALKA